MTEAWMTTALAGMVRARLYRFKRDAAYYDDDPAWDAEYVDDAYVQWDEPFKREFSEGAPCEVCWFQHCTIATRPRCRYLGKSMWGNYEIPWHDYRPMRDGGDPCGT